MTRYFPVAGHSVLGVVEDRVGESHSINLFGAQLAALNKMEFDGATKRNRPDLLRGDIIYARVLSTGRDCGAELSCRGLHGDKKDWNSGEAVYGKLPGGLFERISINYSKRLFQPGNVVLAALSKHYCYEVAIGMNGAVWMRSLANNVIDMVVIRNAILSGETLDDAQVVVLVEELVKLSKVAASRHI